MTTMRAAVLDAPGGPDAFTVRDVPLPASREGWVRIRVRAFGLNRSELMTRRGLSGDAVTFPRILGIEAVGEVDDDPSGSFSPGQQVMTLMGEMGRQYDGGYAEYTSVPIGQVIPFRSELPWDVLGAVPEMLQTAYGSISVGTDTQAGHTLLIRGGTSSVGMTAAVLAHRVGATVISTTRSPHKVATLKELGVAHVVIDDGQIASKVRGIAPAGVDGAIELVGATTLPDTLRAVRPQGVVCFTGMLSEQWSIPDFYPIDVIPQGVRLTAYSGEAHNLPRGVLQEFLDDVAAGHARIPIDTVYQLDEIHTAHQRMDSGDATGKLVVLT
ncbi:zinc-binding alcohol dehydrogenase family protein [Microbacterium arborescens]|uniref:zinc-binding alcohol dehydrogenase family protein n=1 Tax=Microbacterium arborescens TaxID=33883 RepID=UPI003C70F3AA